MTWNQIKALIDRLTKGETLSEDELKAIREYQDTGKSASAKERELQAEIDRLTAEKEEAESKGLPELDKLKKEKAKLEEKLASLTVERDAAIAERAALEFSGAISSLASKHKFSDAEFLKYLVQSKKVDLTDAAAADTFMANLKKESPKHFLADVNPGGGGTPPGNGGGEGGDKKTAKERMEELLKKPNLTMAEASEVAGLEAEISKNTEKK